VPPLQPVEAWEAAVVVEEIQIHGCYRTLDSMAFLLVVLLCFRICGIPDLGCFRLYQELQWA
jgi:hypothetical protein